VYSDAKGLVGQTFAIGGRDHCDQLGSRQRHHHPAAAREGVKPRGRRRDRGLTCELNLC
jgi:hypothetical protein